MIFNKQEKQNIENLIKEVESKSSAELISVITKKSDPYNLFSLYMALFITIISSIILIFISNIDTIKLLSIQIIIFTLSYLLFSKKSSFLLFLIPKKYKYQIASNYANEHFKKLGLHLTQTKQAIMFFVSIEEKYVEIITDSKIKELIPDSFWESIVEQFIKDIHNENISIGYLKAIQSCKDILIKKFPIQENDINELSDEIIELN